MTQTAASLQPHLFEGCLSNGALLKSDLIDQSEIGSYSPCEWVRMSSSSSMLFLQSAMKSSLSTLLDQENGEPAVNLQAMRQLNQIVAHKTLGLGLKQCKKLILIDDAQNYWEKTNRFFRS